MNNKKLIFITICLFFLLYTFFWVWFFNSSKKNQISISRLQFKPVVIDNSRLSQIKGAKLLQDFDEKTKNVLSASDALESALPQSYKTEIIKRKQAFNLSCEFAAALTVLYHFTNNSNFSVENEQKAEKMLIEQIGVSQNPNIGIRMGQELPKDLESLYINLNQRFGGSDYYGVHAPPFIDLFEGYKLRAKPLFSHSEFSLESQEMLSQVQYNIKKALYNGSLIMAWISVGYNKQIDVDLSYTVVPVVRGEHTVVVNGYDKDGVFFMDPGIGKQRYSSYQVFIDATKLFSMPFLEISSSTSPWTSSSSNSNLSIEGAFLADKRAGFSRNNFKIIVRNGTKKVGKASELAEILKDFGYKIVSIENADSLDYEGVTIRFKKEMKDYLYFLKKDLTVAFYNISDITADISKDDQVDAVLTVGD